MHTMKYKFRKDQEKDGQQSAASLNRRRFFKKGGLLVGLVSAFSLTPFSWAHADTYSTNPVQVSDLTGSSAEKYLQATLTSRDYLQFKQHLAQQYPNTFTVQETAPVVVLVQDSSAKLISVHIPVQGGAGQSFFAATLQADTATSLTTRNGL